MPVNLATILAALQAAEQVYALAKQLYQDSSQVLSANDLTTVQTALAEAEQRRKAMQAIVDADLDAAAKR